MAEINWTDKTYLNAEQQEVDVSSLDNKIRNECNAEMQGKMRAPKKISETAPLNDKELRFLAECTTTKRDNVENDVVNEKAGKILADLDGRLRNAALDGKQSMIVMPVKDFSATSSTPPLVDKVMEGLKERNLTVKFEPRARHGQKDQYSHNLVAYWEKYKW